MRTTLVLDETLVKIAKVRAAEHGTTLSEVVNQALRDSFRRGRPSSTPAFSMPTYGSPRRPVRHAPDEFARALEADDLASLRR